MVEEDTNSNEIDSTSEQPHFEHRFNHPFYEYSHSFPNRFFPFGDYHGRHAHDDFPHRFDSSEDKTDNVEEHEETGDENNEGKISDGKLDDEKVQTDVVDKKEDAETTQASVKGAEEEDERDKTDTSVRSRLLPDNTCGLAVDQRVIGGRDVQIGRYPWMTRLGYTSKIYFFLLKIRFFFK